MNAIKSANFTLLLVDDDQALLESIIPHCGDAKLSIQTAANGTKAIEIVNRGPVHLALVDLRLPDLSGIEVLEVIQAAHPRSVRWLMTGYSDFEAAARAVNRAGVHRILLKPLNPLLLKSALRQGLEHLRAELEREQLQTKLREANRRLASALRQRTRDARKFQEELLRTRAELERTFWELVDYSRFSSLGLATGVLAHDLRNPLTVLSGQLQMLSAKEADDPSVACRLSSMMQQVERIQDLVNGFSELSAGRVEGEREFAIGAVIEEALALIHKLFKARGLETVLVAHGAAPRVKGNYGHWVHVIFKLLEYVGQRSSNSSVVIEVGEDEEQVRVGIRFVALPTAEMSFREIIPPRLDSESEASDLQRTAHADSTVFFLCSRILGQYGGRLEVGSSDNQILLTIFYPKMKGSASKHVQIFASLEQEA
jgi:CheY-like chemotaxis protein